MGFEIEDSPADKNGRARHFHLAVRAPAEAWPHRALVRRIIDVDKPAYVTYDLQFAGSPAERGGPGRAAG